MLGTIILCTSYFFWYLNFLCDHYKDLLYSAVLTGALTLYKRRPTLSSLFQPLNDLAMPQFTWLIHLPGWRPWGHQSPVGTCKTFVTKCPRFGFAAEIGKQCEIRNVRNNETCKHFLIDIQRTGPYNIYFKVVSAHCMRLVLDMESTQVPAHPKKKKPWNEEEPPIKLP